MAVIRWADGSEGSAGRRAQPPEFDQRQREGLPARGLLLRHSAAQAVGAAARLEGWGATRVRGSALAVRVLDVSELRASERAGRVAPRICA